MSTYPHLFIRDVGNARESDIRRVIEELGFGRITGIQFRGKNAIAYIYWDSPNTRATRIILEEGTHPLLLYYSDKRFWKVYAYKNRELQKIEELEKIRQFQKLLEQERLEQERLEEERFEKRRQFQKLLEQERLEQERLEQERLEQERLEQERLEEERLEPYIPTDLLTVLDYGNIANLYPSTRAIIRKRMRLNK